MNRRANPRRRFVLAFPAWGQDYVRSLTELTLPMVLAEGNLPWLSRHAETTIAIVTNETSRQEIEAAPIVATVKSLCNLRFFLIDDRSDKFDAFTRAHQIVLDTRQSPTDVFCLLTADIGLDDQYFQFLFQKIEAGYDAVMATGPRTRIAEITQALARYRRADGSLSVCRRDLAGLTLSYLHPSIRVQKWGANTTPRSFASQHIWGNLEDWMYLSSFHLHPTALTNLTRPVHMPQTIDGGWLAEFYGPSAKLYVVEDSDECYACEFSPEKVVAVPARFETEAERIDATALWCALHPDPMMFEYAARGLLVHPGETDAAAVTAARTDAARVLRQIKRRSTDALERLDQWRKSGAERIVADLRAGKSVGLWGLGSDFTKLRARCPDLDVAIEAHPVRLFDRDRAGSTLLRRPISAPNDAEFSGRLYPLPADPDVHWTMINQAVESFPKARVIDIYK